MKFDSVSSVKYFRVIILVLIGCFLAPNAFGTDKTKPEKVEFDFKKTSSYTHDLDKRPDFPVAITLLRNYVYSVLALGETIDTKTKEKIIAFVKKVQKPDGGFSIDPATKETSSLYTDYAVETLSYIGALNSIDAVKAKAYISSLRMPDGGFSFDAKTKESSFPTTYYAVHALSLINGLDIVDKAKTVAYIKGFEKKDTGGFSYVKGTGVATPKSTYMGIYALKALGMLDEGTKKNAIKYLASTPYVGKFRKYEITQTLEEQSYTLMALKMLGAGDKINKNKVVAFIKSFYIPENGGFGPIHGYGSAPDPTYYGIRCLAELGVLKRPAESQVK